MARGNTGTVVSFEVSRTLRTRVFWVGALLGPIMLAVVIAISVASSSSASDVGAPAGQTIAFEWLDHSGLVDPAIATAAGGSAIADAAQGVADVRVGQIDAFFEYPADPTTAPILVASRDAGILDSGQYTGLAAQLLRYSAAQKIDDPALVSLASGTVSTELTTYANGVATPGVWGMIPPLLFIALFFIIVVMQGNRMLTATLEEKENRVTEMILTTIKPTSLLTGKVLALGIIGVIQALVIVIPTVLVGLILTKAGLIGGFDLSRLVFQPVPMLIGAFILVGGFLLFTCSLVAIGAAMPTAKDAQGMFATVLLLLILPVYVIVWMMTSPNNPLVAVLTFFPWTAPITAMARNAFGLLPWWQGVIVIVVLFAAAYLVFRVAARLFQYGSVEYSKKLNWKVALSKS